MGSQTSGLRRYGRRRTSTDSPRSRRLKIVVLGGSGVGKTTLFRRLLNQSPSEEYVPTTSVNIGAKLVVLKDQPPVLVELWDVPDQVYAGKAIVQTYLEAIDGALLVYDVASASSWQSVVDYHALLSATASVRETATPSSPLVAVVVGNKIDIVSEPHAPETTRQAQEWVDQQQQQQAMNPPKLELLHVTVSASQQLHTLELLRTLVQAIQM